ncbi:Membrane metallo-endopeptidase-like 1, partial [Halocaridina rubra]
VNTNISQGENIADNGGLEAAYEAYNKWTSLHGQEPTPSSSTYTPKQLFWLAYASNWCAKLRPEFQEQILESGIHTLQIFRTNGPLQNSPDFGIDWNCPLESNMNPRMKCILW